MSRWKNGFESIREKLRTYPKGRQGRAFARILQFFALMLVLTIFAKGASGVTMPEVTVAMLSQQNIRKEDSYSGMVVSMNTVDVKLPVGLEIDRVYVSGGSSVLEGDPLVSFNADALQQSITRQRVALAEMELALAELLKAAEQEDTGLTAAKEAQQAAQASYDEANAVLVRAGEAVTTAQKAYDDANTPDYREKTIKERIAAANKAYENAVAAEVTAKQHLDDAERALCGLELALSTSTPSPSQPHSYPDNPDWIRLTADVTYWEGVYDAATSATTAANTARLNAPTEVPMQVEREIETLATAIVPAQQARTDAEAALKPIQQALDRANTALAEAQKAYDEATPAFRLEQQKRQLEVTGKQQEIAKQKELLQNLQTMAASAGTVTAPAEGVVASLTLQRGQTTAEGDKITLSTGAEGYVVEFSATREKAQQIRMGAVVGVMRTGTYWAEEAHVVGKTVSEDGNSVTVRAQLPNTGWSEGDAVNATVLYSDRQYGNCVPLAAVRPDNDAYYVLVLQEEQTILGTQTVARRATVQIIDQNNEYAAIDGIYGGDARIVVSSTKPVNDGDMVRLGEGGTA